MVNGKFATTEAWVEAQLDFWWKLRNLPRREACFSWLGEEELGIDWILAFSGGRDASLLDQSNFEIINKDMQERFPDDVSDVGMGHGTDIRWDQMLVRVKDENGNITEAAIALEDWYLRLEDYPVADETHYSNLQYLADVLFISNHYVNKLYCDTSALENGWMHKVYEYLSSIGAEGRGEGFTDFEINDALWGLGYTKQYTCPHCQATWAAQYIDNEWYMAGRDPEQPNWEDYWEITEKDSHFKFYVRQIEEHQLAVRAWPLQTSYLETPPDPPKAPALRDEDGVVVVVIGGRAICPVCLIGEFDVD